MSLDTPLDTFDYTPAVDNFSEITNDNLKHDEPRSLGVEVTRKRAQQLARIKWITRGNVPRVSFGGTYPSHTEYIGLPYSLVMHINTYVGLDVSLYTFMSAVCNPESVMYTENVAKPPYNGEFCAPFYGTVCSTAVWYALGVKLPYFTRFVPDLDILNSPNISTPETIELCDILLSGGHMVMVYDIGRDAEGQIKKVSLFECGTMYVEDTKFIIYSFDDFKKRWENDRWRIFRYKGLDNNTEYEELDFVSVDEVPAKPFVYKKELCTVRGDKVAYREGEKVAINIFDTSFSCLEIYKNDKLYDSKDVKNNFIEFASLPYGDYKARLIKKNKASDFIFFEVLNVDVKVNSNGRITTYFNSKNSTPEYMDFCVKSQSPQAYFPFTDSDKKAKEITVDPVKSENPLYCKVYFRGKYGRVSNVPIEIM